MADPNEKDVLEVVPVDEEEREKHSHLLSLPPHGSEVFIDRLPKDVGEEDLRDLCKAIGEIFEVRLMKDGDSGDSKGYAFVAFKSKDVARKAIEELHSKEFKGNTIRCSLSETKNGLFIRNIPKRWTEDEFRKVIEDVGPGAENIELIKDPKKPTRNRGFAFVLYYNNACADYSRQKMMDSNFKLEGNAPTVTWADPRSSPEHSAAAAQVKALYVKNIPENTSTEQLKELFQRNGEVIKIVTPPGKRDVGFVLYAERSSALKAVKDTEKYEINGQPLQVVLAKPQAERKPDQSYSYGAAPQPAPFVHPTFGGFAAPPYGAMGAGLGIAGGFNQPMIYGRGAMPTGRQTAEDPNRDRDPYIGQPVVPFHTFQHLIRDVETLCLHEEISRAHQQLIQVAGESSTTMVHDVETLTLYKQFMSAQQKFLDKVEELAQGDVAPVVTQPDLVDFLAGWAGNLEGSASRIKPEPEEPLENETKGKAPHWEPFEIMEQETTEIVGKIKYQHNKKRRQTKGKGPSRKPFEKLDHDFLCQADGEVIMGFKKKLMEQSKKKEENMEGNTSASAVGTVNRIDLEKKKIIQQEKRHMEEPSHSAADKGPLTDSVLTSQFETNKMDKEEMMRTLKLKYDEAKKQLLILERLIPKILNSERKKTLHQYVDLMNKSMELRGRVIGKFEEEDFPRLLDSLKNLKSTFLDRISDENKMITKDKRKK